MTFHLLHLKGLPIFDQLKLEEALLRSDERNWCLINQGSSRAIVMGISGKPDQLLDVAKVKEDQIPVIKRFSGGGTVIVDEHTLFVTFICQKEIHSFSAYPEPIMKWSEEMYKSVFPQGQFSLRENDYVLGEKKCGGNAQYIKKDRWLHHTSFLWDYRKENMDYLLHPKKTPAYRAGRPHSDFLCTLNAHFEAMDDVVVNIKRALSARYPVKEATLEEAGIALQAESRQATHFLSLA
jgi:lipoate-protein ligase A